MDFLKTKKSHMVNVNKDDIEMQQGPSVAPIKLERKEDKGMYEITNKGIFMREIIKGRGYYLFMTVWACAKQKSPFFQPLFFQYNPYLKKHNKLKISQYRRASLCHTPCCSTLQKLKTDETMEPTKHSKRQITHTQAR